MSSLNGSPHQTAVLFAQYAGYDPREELQTNPESEPSLAPIPPSPASTPPASPVETVEPEPPTVGQRLDLAAVIHHPFAKVAIVALPGFLGFLALGAFLTSLTGTRDQATSQPAAVSSAPPPSEPNNPPSLITQDELAKYKTEAALARQRQLLERAGQPASNLAKPLPSSPTSQPSPKAPLAEGPAPVSPASPLPITPQGAIAPSLEEALAQWQQVATLGSYGRLEGTSSMNGGNGLVSRPPSPPPFPVPNPNNAFPVPGTAAPPTPTASASSRPSLSQLRVSRAVPSLRETPPAPVLVGSSARAIASTAIVLGTDTPMGADPGNPSATRYLFRLTAPLKDSKGEDAIPADALAVAVVRSFSAQNGLMELQVQSVIVNNQEYQAPTGALVIRSRQGSSLVANRRGGSSSGLGQSLMTGLFAGLAGAGQAINQPSSSVVTSNGGITATTASSRQNVGAAFVSGAFGSLSQQMQQASQMANQRVSQQPVTWEISAGTEVQVFVNSTFEL